MPLLLLPGIVLVGGPEGVHGAVRAGRGGVERVESGGLLPRHRRRRRGQQEAVHAAPQHVLQRGADRRAVRPGN